MKKTTMAMVIGGITLLGAMGAYAGAGERTTARSYGIEVAHQVGDFRRLRAAASVRSSHNVSRPHLQAFVSSSGEFGFYFDDGVLLVVQ